MYQNLDPCQKEAYTNVVVPFLIVLLPTWNFISSTTKYELNSNIVTIVIGYTLWNTDDYEGVSYEKTMRVFNWNNDNGVYVVTVSSSELFRLSDKIIAITTSFK